MREYDYTRRISPPTYPLALQMSILVRFGCGRLEGWQEVLMLSWQALQCSVTGYEGQGPGMYILTKAPLGGFELSFFGGFWAILGIW